MRGLAVALDAPPAFILDSLRLKGTNPVREDMFDNRWMVFPQDFPSAKFLAEQKIRRVTLVQTEKTHPQEDLSHALLRWQEAGIEILAKASGDTTPSFQNYRIQAFEIQGIVVSSFGDNGFETKQRGWIRLLHPRDFCFGIRRDRTQFSDVVTLFWLASLLSKRYMYTPCKSGRGPLWYTHSLPSPVPCCNTF